MLIFIYCQESTFQLHLHENASSHRQIRAYPYQSSLCNIMDAYRMPNCRFPTVRKFHDRKISHSFTEDQIPSSPSVQQHSFHYFQEEYYQLNNSHRSYRT